MGILCFPVEWDLSGGTRALTGPSSSVEKNPPLAKVATWNRCFGRPIGRPSKFHTCWRPFSSGVGNHSPSTIIPRKSAGPCQPDATGMVDAAVFPVSRCGQRSARRAPDLSGIALDLMGRACHIVSAAVCGKANEALCSHQLRQMSDTVRRGVVFPNLKPGISRGILSRATANDP